MSAPRCQGCGRREGGGAKARFPRPRHKLTEFSVELAEVDLADYGRRLLCQPCLAWARVREADLIAAGRAVGTPTTTPRR